MTLLSFDTETFLIGNGRQAPPMVCASFATDAAEPYLHLRDDALHLVERALREPDTHFVGQNVAYDFGVVAAERPDLLPLIFAAYGSDNVSRVHDIRVRDMMLLNARGELQEEAGRIEFTLEGIVRRRFGVDISADKKASADQPVPWRLRYSELDGVPLEQWPEEAVRYVLDDARWPLRVYEDQEAERARLTAELGADPLHDEPGQTRAAFALHLMACWGILTDEEAVLALEARLSETVGAAREKLIASGILKGKGKKSKDTGIINVEWAKDTKKIKAMVEAALGAATPKTDPSDTYPEGQTKTDEETLRETGDADLLVLADVMGDEKLLTTYVQALKGRIKRGNTKEYDQRGLYLPGRGWLIQSSPNVLVASGRTSWSKPNLQNPPRKGGVRECFVPRPGYWFLSVDYSFIELVTWAQTCIDLLGYSKLADAIRAGLDPHVDMGVAILRAGGHPGLTHTNDEDYRIVNTARKRGEVWAKDARQLAKCFHPDTEVLTRGGWKRVVELQEGEQVAAATPAYGGEMLIEWQRARNVFTKPSDGTLVHLRNEGIDLRVTADHRMLAFRQDQRTRRVGKPVVVLPEELGKVRYWPNAGACADGDRVVDENLLRLAVAVQADGSYPKHGNTIRLGFSKRRKIERMRALLAHWPDNWSESVTSQGATQFVVDRVLAEQVKALLDDKKLPWWWVELTPRLRQVVLDETPWWDGHNSNPKWTQFAYYSTIKQNIDVMQTIATLEGRKTRVRVEVDKNPEHATSYMLSVKDHHLTRGGNLETNSIPYDGDVACFSVDSSFVVVRDGGVPVITGQCANFGLPGGLGAATFCAYAKATYDVVIAEDRARQLKDIWRMKWTEADDYFNHINGLIPFGAESATVVLPRTGFVRGDCRYTAACNTYFQGLAARGAKEAMWRVARACYEGRYLEDPEALHGCRPVAFLHDEMILEVPAHRERAHEASLALQQVMEDGMKKFVPDVPVKTEPTLMARWYKEAEPVYGKDGMLELWTTKEVV